VGIEVGVTTDSMVSVEDKRSKAELFILKMKKIPNPDKISRTMDRIRYLVFLGSIHL